MSEQQETIQKDDEPAETEVSVGRRIDPPTERASSRNDETTSSSSMTTTSDNNNLRRTSIEGRGNRSIASAMELKAQEALQDLPMSQLRYDSVGFVGREKELQGLMDCLDRLLLEPSGEQGDKSTTIIDTRNKNMELVLIKGYSGVGKSKLAETFLEKATKTNSIAGVRTKFDLNSREEAFSGIARAFGQICDSLSSSSTTAAPDVAMEKDGDSNQDFGKTLIAELGENEVDFLASMIPELGSLLPVDRIRSSRSMDVHAQNSQVEHDKWKYAMRVLTRVLNSYLSPMVILLDDLQWVDASSLEVLDFILTDTQNNNKLMLLGSYRSNEVDDNHILSKLLAKFEASQDDYSFNITNIEVGSFGEEDVNKIIASMLAIEDEERTAGLANICFRRTEGNVHFLIQFVTMLQEEKLLTFNLGLLKWAWDEKLVENETMSTANVVDLLKVKMKRLPATAQLLLRTAACLGATIRLSTLTFIWSTHEEFQSIPDAKHDILDWMRKYKEWNFIESRNDGLGVYRFVHDKVQEAALLLGDTPLESFQFDIGSTLYSVLGAAKLENMLFEVCNLINKGRHLKDQPQFAELNLKAAVKAKELSAFESAAEYVSMGITFLASDNDKDSRWTKHRELSLRLYTVGAEVELALGRPEKMEEYSSQVLFRDDFSAMEKVPLYETQANKLSSLELKYDETINFCLEVLEELDVKLLWSPAFRVIQALSSLFLTVRTVKRQGDQIYAGLGRVGDPKQEAVMALLGRLVYSSFFCKNEIVLILATTAMVRHTLKHGVTAMSGFGFGTLGLLSTAVLQDFESASFLGEAALSLKETASAQYAESSTSFMTYMFVLGWRRPLLSFLPLFLEGYKSGMRVGDTEYAMWHLCAHRVIIPFVIGRPLGALLEPCRSCIAECDELNQLEQSKLMKAYLRIIENLTGKSENKTNLAAEPLNGDARVNAAHYEVSVKSLQTALFVFFGDFASAASLALEVGDDFEKCVPGSILNINETFYRAVALFAMARQTRKGKFIQPAKKVAWRITKWIRSANPNVRHMHSFLKAEQAALDKNYDVADAGYKQAIVLAARTGHLHHRALFNERYAHFLRSERGDIDEWTYQMGEAKRFYLEWGADAKVGMLVAL